MITFEYKDYKDNSKIKHYELLSNRNKKKNIRLYRLPISRKQTNEFVSTISRKFHEFKCKKCGSTNFSYSFQYDIHRTTSNSLYNILEFHTLGASGKSIQNWVI